MSLYPCKYFHLWQVPGRCEIDDKECLMIPKDACVEYVPIIPQVQPDAVEDFPTVFHKFCVSHHIEKACILFNDETAYDYLWLSDKEFQLSRVGDMPTNYVLSEPDFQRTPLGGWETKPKIKTATEKAQLCPYCNGRGYTGHDLLEILPCTECEGTGRVL